MPVLFLIVFIDLLGFGVIIPLLPYYAQHFGAAPDKVTLMMAIYSLMQFFAAPIWGQLSDRYGRKPILLISMAGAAISYLCMGLASSLWMLFAARGFAGAMAGNIAAAQAYIADVTKPEDRAKGMGLIGAAFGLGLIFGPAMGGLLGGSDPVAPDFGTPFFVAAAISASAIVSGFFLLKESRSPGQRGAVKFPTIARRIRMLARAVTTPVLGVLVLQFFLVTFVFAGMESTFALWSERAFGWGPAQNGYLFAYAGVIAAGVQGGLIGHLTRRFGEARLVILGAVVLGIGMILITAAAHDLPVLLAAMAALALGAGLGNPSLSSLISRRTPADRQGSVLGIAQSASSLARIAGPAWAGAVFQHFGRNAPYLSGALAMVAGVALAVYSRSLLTRVPQPGE